MLVAILGAGAWGTALALVAARAGHRVLLIARDPLLARTIGERRENPRHLPGIALPLSIEARAEMAAVATAELVLVAVPTQALRRVVADLPDLSAPFLLCCKGLELGTGLRPSQVVLQVRPQVVVGSLSGPSFAREVAEGRPTAVSLAFPELATARTIAQGLRGPTFRPYPTDDLIGVELGGALKNVIAIAAGIVSGRGLGENARAALVTRGLAEIARLAEACGARRTTLMGLSGLGDLVLTATSLTSRNMRLGHAIGGGRPPAELLGEGAPLAEGAFTAEAACTLARELGLELPIAEAVRRVLAGETSVDGAIETLLARPLPDSE